MAKTLLQMAGADLTPPKLGDAVLVVIDAQREYVDGARHPERQQGVAPQSA